MPSAFVRVDAPTYTVEPTFSTSPPSSVPGCRDARDREPGIARTARSTASISGRRDSAPGFVITARSPKNTTVSSTKTESARSGAASTSTVSQPSATSAAQ